MPKIIPTGEASWVIQNDDGSVREATSYEVNIAQALMEAGWYQWEFIINFFLSPSKSLEIDFAVYTVPKQTFIFVDGNFWHSGIEKSQDEVERILLFAKSKDFANFPLTVNNQDCATIEAARAWVLKNFGRR